MDAISQPITMYVHHGNLRVLQPTLPNAPQTLLPLLPLATTRSLSSSPHMCSQAFL